MLYRLRALGMAVVSLGFGVLQAFVVQRGCALCLVSAVVSWAVAALVVPQAVRTWRDGDTRTDHTDTSRSQTLPRAA